VLLHFRGPLDCQVEQGSGPIASTFDNEHHLTTFGASDGERVILEACHTAHPPQSGYANIDILPGSPARGDVGYGDLDGLCLGQRVQESRLNLGLDDDSEQYVGAIDRQGDSSRESIRQCTTACKGNGTYPISAVRGMWNSRATTRITSPERYELVRVCQTPEFSYDGLTEEVTDPEQTKHALSDGCKACEHHQGNSPPCRCSQNVSV
jgi:hypothetical protein